MIAFFNLVVLFCKEDKDLPIEVVVRNRFENFQIAKYCGNLKIARNFLTFPAIQLEIIRIGNIIFVQFEIGLNFTFVINILIIIA